MGANSIVDSNSRKPEPDPGGVVTCCRDAEPGDGNGCQRRGTFTLLRAARGAPLVVKDPTRRRRDHPGVPGGPEAAACTSPRRPGTSPGTAQRRARNDASIPKWTTGTDCKSVGYGLRRFESCSTHHARTRASHPVPVGVTGSTTGSGPVGQGSNPWWGARPGTRPDRGPQRIGAVGSATGS